MIDIIVSEEFEGQVDAAMLEKAAQLALLRESAPDPADLAIAIENDEQLRQLNLQFLNVDSPTDVLSFPANEQDPETGRLYLGDIIISLERARAQSVVAGHPLESELQLLVVHGVLHLLGHDHYEPEEKARMWAAQAEILNQLGLDIKKLPED